MGMTVGGHAWRAVNSGLDVIGDTYGMLTQREADPMAIVDQQQAMAQRRPEYPEDLPPLEPVPTEPQAAAAAAAAEYVDVDISPPKRRGKGKSKAAQVELVIQAAKAKAEAEHYRMDADDSDWADQSGAPAAGTSMYDILNNFRKGRRAYDQEEEVAMFHPGRWGR
jgi:hypothetical protein